MAGAIDSSKHIMAGLLLLSFLLLILVASRQIMQPVKDTGKEVHDKEGFKVAPTRAAECKCLPGYVPSNEEPKIEFLLDPRGWGYLQVGNKVYGYWWGMHGIWFDWTNTKYRWVATEYLSKLEQWSSDSGKIIYAPKHLIEEGLRQQKGERKANNTYICQNLADAGDVKECY